MILDVLAWTSLALASVPALTLARNLSRYRVPPPPSSGSSPRAVSLLIPARNEAATIDAALAAARESRGVDLEVVVMDDASEDDTAHRVEAVAAVDPRVRLVRAPPLPSGWCGKQHACAALAREARHDVLAFVDADVRLAPGALARAAAFLEASGAGLVSGFPWQETGTFSERLVIPLIHLVLLGYLPMGRMRRSLAPAYAAGCGQWMVARRDAYEAAGGHAAIRASRHDGITLPRAFRRAGWPTDLFDATPLATCRMYDGARAVWNGLAKNATEGLANPKAIVPWSILLLGGHVLPFALLVPTLLGGRLLLPAAVGAALALGSRLALAARFRQPLGSAVLHPLGVLVLVAVQVRALVRRVLGRPLAWKGRTA